MKSPISLILLLALHFTTAGSKAANVALQLSGTIQTSSAGAPFPVGTPFYVGLFFSTEFPEDFPRNLQGPQFTELPTSSVSSLGATSFFAQSLYVTTVNTPETPGLQPPPPLHWQAIFSLLERAPFGTDNSYVTKVFFHSATNFFHDGSSLPSSINDWNLLAADFEFRFEKAGSSSDPIGWSVSSTQYAAISLTVLPEPSICLLGLAAAGGFSWRRRRWAQGICIPDGTQ
jgi:hypothetical protein